MGGRPNRTVFLVNKKTKIYTRIGVGWETLEGKLSIVLNPGIVLDWRMCESFYININEDSLLPTQDSKLGDPDMDNIPF